jgi:hypothetical protein
MAKENILKTFSEKIENNLFIENIKTKKNHDNIYQYHIRDLYEKTLTANYFCADTGYEVRIKILLFFNIKKGRCSKRNNKKKTSYIKNEEQYYCSSDIWLTEIEFYFMIVNFFL